MGVKFLAQGSAQGNNSSREPQLSIEPGTLQLPGRCRLARVRSGVPQGSVLGPLLFFLSYVDDLRSVVRHSTLKLFADDVALYIEKLQVLLIACCCGKT